MELPKFSEQPILLHNTRGREGYRSDDEDSIIESEKNGLRRRRVKNDKNEEDEQELLDKYSYLTALEQEIERKKKQLVDEERILYEKEQEIQQRKQHLQSISSQSSSNTGNEISPLITQRKGSVSSSVTSASEIIVNYYDKPVLTEELPQTPDSSVISQDALADPKINPSSISEHNNHSTGYHQQHSYPVAKSIASEEAWSEIESVLSENIGSIMSSAVDIDMEEVDVIEH
ncbi:hypothetical protein GLOIN_2v1571930 [Rhizophagus clarus]|uniref:Uncharacterized protein n=1 Tax=Rhizophagus clarus TaxID=94130 RepID=A0A8H3QBT5_9GLOM|nr:hypothetical protein GLOIN_2v1571930 [Rhizophagus clarus]